MKNYKKPTLVILVGNIGSGKSTLCSEYAQKGSIIVSRDSLRYMIGNGRYRFDPKLETAIWSSELHLVEEFMKLRVNLVADEVGLTPRMRQRYLRLAKLYHYTPIAVILPRLPMKQSVDRRMKNPHGQPDRQLWEMVWKKFDIVYEEPTLDEGFKKIIRKRR